jgi:hydrogenase-4 component F
MIWALVLIPALSGLLAFWLRPDRLRRALLVFCAGAHSSLTVLCWVWSPTPILSGWFALDQPGILFLSITSLLFLAASFYAVGYLRREERGTRRDFEEWLLFANAPEATFTGCLLLFLSTMTSVAASRHLGFLWVAIEATTLASAPLIYFHRHRRSLEATWKYLLICSVGIALALLGNFLLAASGIRPGEGPASLYLDSLLKNAPSFHVPWLRAAFLFLLVGYGTKMGLAPLHTWLPDAHSEAPSVVSALLSGALLNCAFLGILRAFQVCVAAGQAPFCQDLLTGFGLLSMALAAAFIVGQADYKRMLAYSSVEHMGILALGVGLGGAAASGAILHAINHSFTKGMFFLLAGNVLAAYRTKSTAEVRGMLKVLPVSSILWVMTFLAITGSPPFGPFLSELKILKGALDQDRATVAVLYLAFLGVIFIGMATSVLRMVQGEPPESSRWSREKGTAVEPMLAVVPPLALGVLVLLLGLYIPPFLSDAIGQAAQLIGGS